MREPAAQTPSGTELLFAVLTPALNGAWSFPAISPHYSHKRRLPQNPSFTTPSSRNAGDEIRRVPYSGFVWISARSTLFGRKRILQGSCPHRRSSSVSSRNQSPEAGGSPGGTSGSYIQARRAAGPLCFRKVERICRGRR